MVVMAGEIKTGATCKTGSHTEMADRTRIVIIGGGFGGLTAARCLGNCDLDVTLIDRTNHHLFQPLLYRLQPLPFSRRHRLAIAHDLAVVSERAGCAG